MVMDFVRPSSEHQRIPENYYCSILMESGNGTWASIAQWLGTSVPSKGDIIFVEDINGPLEVVKTVWGLKNGHPITCDIHVQGSHYPAEDPSKP